LTLTLIVPTYQERHNIEPFLRQVFACVPHARVLVVDDNSPDGTADAVRALIPEFQNLDLMVRKNKDGLGRAYVAGFRRVLDECAAGDAIGQVIGMLDADFSHDPAAVPGMLAALKDSDMAIGSRYTRGGGIQDWETWRRTLSSLGNLYASTVTGMPVSDATSGFNMIRAARLRHVPLESLRSSGYAFQIELKYRLWRSGARLREVPITFGRRREGESKITNHIVFEGILTPWALRFRSKADQ
jgi:dolichol-phosphate mannosyltransferase